MRYKFKRVEKEMDKLQQIPNSAAQIVSGVKKFDHVHLNLKELYWLPVDKRIKHKLLSITCMLVLPS